MLDKLEETPRQPVANCSSILPTVSCGFPTDTGGAYIVALRRGRLESTAGLRHQAFVTAFCATLCIIRDQFDYHIEGKE